MNVIADAKEIISVLENTVNSFNDITDTAELVNKVCEKLNKPMLRSNPLFSKTVECCRKEKN